MRISDWSSDVCSSDLADAGLLEGREMGEADLQGRRDAVEVGLQELMAELPRRLALRPGLAGALIGPHQHAAALLAGVDLALDDRKSVLKGKRESVRVDHDGRRNNKQKKKNQIN